MAKRSNAGPLTEVVGGFNTRKRTDTTAAAGGGVSKKAKESPKAGPPRAQPLGMPFRATRARSARPQAVEQAQGKDKPAAGAVAVPARADADACYPVARFEESGGPNGELGPETVVVSPEVNAIYRAVAKKTYLDWGLTSDWDVSNGGGRRASRGPAASEPPVAAAPRASAQVDSSSSQGYGEATAHTLQRLLQLLMRLRSLVLQAGPPPPAANTTKGRSAGAAATWGPEWDLTPASTFLDVGSGYGKVVFHTWLAARPASAAGIELVPSRHRLASELLAELATGGGYGGVSLAVGDAAAAPRLDYSHVYMFDKVFSEGTHAALAAVLARSRFRVLVSFQRAEKWARLGRPAGLFLREVAAVPLRTTGKQVFLAHVYVNVTPAA